jgi:glutaconate CoA-transferase subunit B
VSAPDVGTLDFLVRAAREFRRGGWVFTGFHWPVLAGQLAHHLPGAPFTQAFEAGATTHGPGRLVPTSTTDYPAYGNALGYAADTASVLLAMARRFDRVVLDAGTVDLRGCVNSSVVGEHRRPTVRLPGGGGAPDVAAAARELVWLHGGADLRRIQARVEHVTAAPGPHTRVRLHTRWGVVRVGADPALEEVADVDGAEEFAAHLAALGARTDGAAPRPPVDAAERAAAAALLREAADRGYAVARRALAEAAAR